MENLKVKIFENNNDFEDIDDNDENDFYELMAQEKDEREEESYNIKYDLYPEETEQYIHLKKIILNDFIIDEKDYYYLLKKILNEKYILVEKTRLNKYQLKFIKKYIELIKKIKSLDNFFEQVKYLLSNKKALTKAIEIEKLNMKRAEMFDNLLDFDIIDLA